MHPSQKLAIVEDQFTKYMYFVISDLCNLHRFCVSMMSWLLDLDVLVNMEV